jgi:hypothetical protein
MLRQLRVMKTNLMHYRVIKKSLCNRLLQLQGTQRLLYHPVFILSIFRQSLHVSGISVAHHQEIYCIYRVIKMIDGVLTTCHTQCIFFNLIEQHSMFLLHTLQVLYMCNLCDSTNINTIIEFVPNCL